MSNATFRFYEELNDFLPPDRRGGEFSSRFAQRATVKQAIEALGVPHTEVELILLNGESVGFGHLLGDGDRVAVYPKFEAFDLTPLLRLRADPLRSVRFVADAHLGGLARLLRLGGLDTLFRNDYADAEIASLSVGEGRILLTRDRDLLKRREITHGCFVRALKPVAQFREILDRLDLYSSLRPFARCLICNGPLRRIDKAQVADRLPSSVAQHQQNFTICDACGRVYWPGSHWRRMSALLAELGSPQAAAPAGAPGQGCDGVVR